VTVPPEISPHGVPARKVVAHETAWAVGDQGLTVVSQTVAFLLLGKSLGAAGYGPYLALFALMGPIFSFANAGVSLAVLEHVVREKEDRSEVVRSTMSIVTIVAVVTTPIIVFIASLTIESISSLTAALLVLSELLLGSLVMAMISMVMAHEGFIPAAKLRMMVSSVRITLFLCLWGSGQLNLDNLAIAQIATVSTVMWICARRVASTMSAWPLPGRVYRRHIRSTFVYGTGLAASGIQNEGDKFILDAYRFEADAGRYGAAFRIVQFGLLPINSLLFSTHISYLESGRANADVMRRSLRLGGLCLIYGIAVGGVLYVAAPLVPQILGDDFAETASMIRWLSPVIVLRGVGTFPMNGLLGLGRNGLRTVLLVTTSALSVVLYVTLIPKYSWEGAVAGTLISEALLFVLAWGALYTSQKQRDRRLDDAPHDDASEPLTSDPHTNWK